MFDAESFKGHVLVPVGLFERMAACYYGGGPSLAEAAAERSNREAAKVRVPEPTPSPEHVELRTEPSVRWKPQGAAARAVKEVTPHDPTDQ